MQSTPLLWRLILGIGIALSATAALYGRDTLDARTCSALGLVTFLAVVAFFSTNLRAVNPRVVLAGMFLQCSLALLILRVDEVRQFFDHAGTAVTRFVGYSRSAAGFLFGPVANGEQMDTVFGPHTGIPFFIILVTTVVFVACIFSILYHLGILQMIVWTFAKLMMLLMGRGGVIGAESLSAAGNIFMGQTEAPLIVKPYLLKMTRSELLAIMIGGMATVAGGVMAIYIEMGAEAKAILATSVMAAPCGLYISKILVPETEVPVTRGTVNVAGEKPHTNVIDAATAGASEGMTLALNIIAMLIAFLALIALINGGLKLLDLWSLEKIFAWLFSPVAALIGVDTADIPKVAQLLGMKLVSNEFIAFKEMTTTMVPGTPGGISQRSYSLATYALTGFANIGSVGIQIGGIGALAKERRGDLARLGLTALLGGFTATLINACIAGMIAH